jgi:hypothetical protein
MQNKEYAAMSRDVLLVGLTTLPIAQDRTKDVIQYD